MDIVWNILALIIGVVVAYLMYEEFVVGRENAPESEAEKEIEDDLLEIAHEAGVAESVESLAERAPTEEVEIEGDLEAAADERADDDVEAEAVVEAEVDADVAEEEIVSETVGEVAEEAAEAVEETSVEEITVEDAAPVETPDPDDLTKIKGIGPVYVKRLNEAGIYTYDQLIETDVDKLTEITQAIPAANAYDWARQAEALK